MLLIYGVLVSGIQQSDSVMHIYLLFQILSLYRLYKILSIVPSGGSDGKASVCNAGDPGLIPGSGNPLEKEMATHSSTLAWKIPWTEEPGRLQSMGSQRVGHD